MEQFRAAALEAAEAIDNGSLYAGDEYPDAQQVHRSSWKYLAQINRLGFLTILSQDALYSRTGESNDTERAYVTGSMPRDLAEAFVTDFNVNNDSMIACLSVGVPKEQLLPRGYRIGITNREVVSGKIRIRGISPGLTDQRMIKHLDDIYGEGLLMIVDVMDTKWGRPATSRKGLWRAVISALV